MSFRLVDEVFDLDLPSTEKLVLLALARHADHDGSNTFPSVNTLMRETGFCDRQVRKCLKALRNKRIIVAVKGGICGVTVYKIEIAAAPRHPPARYAVPPALSADNSVLNPKAGEKQKPLVDVGERPYGNLYPSDDDEGIHDEAPRTFLNSKQPMIDKYFPERVSEL